jgi:hypothetical protein
MKKKKKKNKICLDGIQQPETGWYVSNCEKEKNKEHTHTHGKRNNFLPALTSFSKRLPNNTAHTHTHTEGATTHIHKRGEKTTPTRHPLVFLSLSPTLYCLIHSHQKTKTGNNNRRQNQMSWPFSLFPGRATPLLCNPHLFLLLGVLDLTLQLTRESQKRQKQTNKSPKKHKKSHTMYT